MTGNELKEIRLSLCLGKTAFGKCLGYATKPENIKRYIYRAESLKDEAIPEGLAQRVLAYMQEDTRK